MKITLEFGPCAARRSVALGDFASSETCRRLGEAWARDLPPHARRHLVSMLRGLIRGLDRQTWLGMPPFEGDEEDGDLGR